MSSIEQSITTVLRVADQEHGSAALAKATGVAATTISSLKKRGFKSHSINLLIKLVEGAEKIEAAKPEPSE